MIACCCVLGIGIQPLRAAPDDRWKNFSVGVFKYLFVRDIVAYESTEGIVLKGSGACRAIGHSGGYAIHSTSTGSCRIDVTITNTKTGKISFRGSKTVQSKMTMRSRGLPRKSPIPVRIPGSKRCSHLRSTSGMALPDWTCQTSANSWQIFNASLYDWFVGLKQQRDFYPQLISNRTMDQLCVMIMDAVKKSGATLIDVAKCDSRSRRPYEYPFICARKGNLTVIWNIGTVYESSLLYLTTMWQTAEALTPDFEDLVDNATDEAPVAGADYTGLWSACEELQGRPPRVPSPYAG